MTMYSFNAEGGLATGTEKDGERCKRFTKQLKRLFWRVYEAEDLDEVNFGVGRWCKRICDRKYGEAPECDVAWE